jgi:pimeloyl-ACP methyl ester carboxylesterase
MNNLIPVNGIHLHVERLGRGEPVLLIPGLGAGAWLWLKTAPALSKHFSVIMPELRGGGRSDKPDRRYSVSLFANDLREMLENLDIKKTHVIGVSMGGFIAQFMAATWPERVGALVLVATSLGGDGQLGPSGEVLSRTIRPRGKTRQERLEDSYSLNFSQDYRTRHPEELQRITEWRTQFPQPEFAYYRQLLAGYAFDGSQLVKRISAPTLIAAGKDDPFVPLEDTLTLKNNFGQSEFALFDGRHLFFFEHSKKFNQLVIEFLQKHPFSSNSAGTVQQVENQTEEVPSREGIFRIADPLRGRGGLKCQASA